MRSMNTKQQYLVVEKKLLAGRLADRLTEQQDETLVAKLLALWQQIPARQQRNLDNDFATRLIHHVRQQGRAVAQEHKEMRHDDTSRSAKQSIQNDLPRLRLAVRTFVKDRGYRGATCDEIEQGLDLKHQTVSARCTELLKAGQILDSGARRPTRSGRSARVYVLALSPFLK